MCIRSFKSYILILVKFGKNLKFSISAIFLAILWHIHTNFNTPGISRYGLDFDGLEIAYLTMNYFLEEVVKISAPKNKAKTEIPVDVNNPPRYEWPGEK